MILLEQSPIVGQPVVTSSAYIEGYFVMLEARLIALRESFWFLPAIYNMVALALAITAVLVDYELTVGHSLLGVAPLPLDRTTDMLAALAAAILTMTTITFSGILVVLTTYSGQFSPRALQNFVANRLTQHVLALFSSGFTFCILTLLILNDNDADQLLATPILAVAWSLAGIAAFIFLLHHTTNWLRVSNLIGFIAEETDNSMRRVLKQDIDDCRQMLNHSHPLWREEGIVLTAPVSGYVILIDLDALMRKAIDSDVTLRLEVATGDFVLEGMPLMTLIGSKTDDIDLESLCCLVRMAVEPKGWQDIAFGLRKVAEIGLRAISPAINDPYTAATCIHHMAALLVTLSRRGSIRNAFLDKQRQPRMLSREPDFEHYLLCAFQELRRYGKADNTTLVAILEALGWIARMGDSRWHDLLWDFAADTYRLACRSTDLLESEHQRLRLPLKQLAETVCRNHELLLLLESQRQEAARAPCR